MKLPYVCGVCQKELKTMGEVYEHQEKVHPLSPSEKEHKEKLWRSEPHNKER